MHAIAWRRAAGWAAVAIPVLMWVDFLTMGISRAGYNLLTRPFSDLATTGTPNAAIFSAGFFFLPGILTVLLGVGLSFGVPGNLAWRLGAAMVMVAGVFLVFTGVFPQDPRVPMAAILHGTVSQVCFGIASAAPLVLFAGSRGRLHMPAPRRLWLGLGVASLAIEAFGVLVRPATHLPYGVFQRPFTVVLTAFFVTTGFWLLRGRQIEGLSVPD
ncbi:MAG TPA: DUF998 domain-containing protein [Candidatus Dormibacteraeota bacterium]|nr:DUF998 domain-containing protein [Candidatus Dormibacteraeota bacterium]